MAGVIVTIGYYEHKKWKDNDFYNARRPAKEVSYVPKYHVIISNKNGAKIFSVLDSKKIIKLPYATRIGYYKSKNQQGYTKVSISLGEFTMNVWVESTKITILSESQYLLNTGKFNELSIKAKETLVKENHK